MENKSEKELDAFIQNESKPTEEMVLPDWRKDKKNIFLLIFLYFLQGVNLRRFSFYMAFFWKIFSRKIIQI